MYSKYFLLILLIIFISIHYYKINSTEIENFQPPLFSNKYIFYFEDINQKLPRDQTGNVDNDSKFIKNVNDNGFDLIVKKDKNSGETYYTIKNESNLEDYTSYAIGNYIFFVEFKKNYGNNGVWRPLVSFASNRRDLNDSYEIYCKWSTGELIVHHWNSNVYARSISDFNNDGRENGYFKDSKLKLKKDATIHRLVIHGRHGIIPASKSIFDIYYSSDADNFSSVTKTSLTHWMRNRKYMGQPIIQNWDDFTRLSGFKLGRTLYYNDAKSQLDFNKTFLFDNLEGVYNIPRIRKLLKKRKK